MSMPPWQGMARMLVVYKRSDSNLLLHFPQQCSLERFSCFDMATDDVPRIRTDNLLWAASAKQQHSVTHNQRPDQC